MSPETGRARLSYRRAEEIFEENTRLLANPLAGAMAALQRGEPCGLALACAGAWVEWSARPALFLPLADGAPGTPAPRRAGRPTGFGAPLTPRNGFP
ncbi:hypothetical protein [Streptomyces auratus]|uniref:hypothetical protein n=1 Tax=Streptomyces auratus TaxID=114687 RepID=UPI003D21F5C2